MVNPNFLGSSSKLRWSDLPEDPWILIHAFSGDPLNAAVSKLWKEVNFKAYREILQAYQQNKLLGSFSLPEQDTECRRLVYETYLQTLKKARGAGIYVSAQQ